MSTLKSMWMLVVLAAALAACGVPAAPPTQTSQDVLRTAQAIAELTLNAPSETATAIPQTATATAPAPTEVPTATVTPNFPAVTAKYNVSVRSGPGEDYPIVDLFLQGQAAQVIGRIDATDIGTWYLVVRIGQGINGWVWSGATDISGDLSGVPVLEAPPTPKPD